MRNAADADDVTQLLSETQEATKNTSRTVVLLNAASALDGCDDQLLPASFRVLESELGFHPSLLGKITLSQTLALSCSCPLWGYLSDRYPRNRVMALGIISWGVATSLLAFASSVSHIFILRVFNGFFLGSMGPLTQAVIVDKSTDLTRGYYFGLVQMCSSAGRTIGGAVTTSVAFLEFGGFRGWRWTVLAVGCMSFVVGLLIGIMSPSEFSTSSSTRKQEEHFQPFVKMAIMESLKPTIILLILEGMVGNIPWSAMSFLTMYLQYCGVSDARAGAISGSLLLGAMISGPIGGMIGDKLHSKYPNCGRPFMGQISMLIRVPLLYVGFRCIPPEPHFALAKFFVFFSVGLASFGGVVVNRPLLADVVNAPCRSTVFGIVVALEGICGALIGAPGVGFLVESHFGYIKSSPTLILTEEIRRNNANALGSALLLLTTIPWAASFLIYGLLHFTYSKDKVTTS